MRRALQIPSLLPTAALLTVLSASVATAQVVPNYPTSGTTAGRIGAQEAGTATSVSASPRIVATARIPWFTLPRWSDLSPVKVATVRPEWAALRRKLTGR